MRFLCGGALDDAMRCDYVDLCAQTINSFSADRARAHLPGPRAAACAGPRGPRAAARLAWLRPWTAHALGEQPRVI